jgi:hypothetical protein
VALEVGDDGAGDLAQVGGVGQQPGQVAQLAGRQLSERAGAVGLGDVVQQGDEQLVGVGVLLGQPGAGVGSRLGLAQPVAVGHGGLLLAYRPYLARSCSALARQAAASSGKPVEAALADRPS